MYARMSSMYLCMHACMCVCRYRLEPSLFMDLPSLVHGVGCLPCGVVSACFRSLAFAEVLTGGHYETLMYRSSVQGHCVFIVDDCVLMRQTCQEEVSALTGGFYLFMIEDGSDRFVKFEISCPHSASPGVSTGPHCVCRVRA